MVLAVLIAALQPLFSLRPVESSRPAPDASILQEEDKHSQQKPFTPPVPSPAWEPGTRPYLEVYSPYRPAPVLPPLPEQGPEMEEDVLSDQEAVLPATGSKEDLLLPDLITQQAYDLRLVLNSHTRERLLRFSSAFLNSGAGPLELHGKLDDDRQRAAVTQYIYYEDGSFEEVEVGEFYFHEEHNHWHWDGFATYEVWSIDEDGAPSGLLYSSDKVGYCMRDDRRVLDPGEHPDVALSQEYGSCNWNRQGISVGWVDIYRSNTPGQFVEATWLEDGIVYALRTTANPENIIQEQDPSNNESIVYFMLSGTQVEVIDDPDEATVEE